MSRGSYADFLDALGERESGGDYAAVNSLGFLGKYQFGEAALVDAGFYRADGTAKNDWRTGYWTGELGVNSKADFLSNPAAQEAAIRAYMDLQWSYLQPVRQYDGEVVAGIKITVSGMLAGAHLLGAGTLAAFVDSGGDIAAKDAYGTPLTEYIGKFASYRTPYSIDHAAGETLDGGSHSDILRGFGGDDVLSGEAGKDKVIGGSGDDRLAGGAGHDRLIGGRGADIFLFDDATAAANSDRIVDFRLAKDRIELDGAVFKALPDGPLAEAAFWRGAMAHDADDRIVYDPKSGVLFYDPDGGSPSEAVPIATLSKHLGLSHADLVVA